MKPMADPFAVLHARIEARAYLWLSGDFSGDIDEVIAPLYAFAERQRLKLSRDQIGEMMLDALQRWTAAQ